MTRVALFLACPALPPFLPALPALLSTFQFQGAAQAPYKFRNLKPMLTCMPCLPHSAHIHRSRTSICGVYVKLRHSLREHAT